MKRRVRPGPILAAALIALLLSACSGGDDTPPVGDPVATSAAPPSRPSSPSASAAPRARPSPASPESPATSPPDAGQLPRLNAKLIEAAWNNDLQRVTSLIARGADVNAKDDTEQSAYLISTSEGYQELLELTLRHGADVDAKDSFNGTGLIRAADRGHAAIAGRLLQAGVDVDHVNRLGWTALHEAIILGDGSARYLDTVRVLVAGDADVALSSRRDGVSPLVHAKSRGFEEIAGVLRDALDADPVSGEQANRRLVAAAQQGNADAVALALRSGANPTTRDARGRTARQLAEARGHEATSRLLSYVGAER